MNVIEVNHLTKDYGSGRGVFDVDLRVEKGEVFGFLGPNGAGKSTTIRHLMGFSRPDQGETKIFGKPTFVRYHEILSEVGYIPGEIALPAGLTGWGFIDMMRELKKRPKKDRLDEMLRLFELDDAVLKGETKRMSLGVKRKLAVVTAFMSDPEVLILDEPTSGLDPVMQEKFIAFIHEEKARGKTILLQSHLFRNRFDVRPHRDHQGRQDRLRIHRRRSETRQQKILYDPFPKRKEFEWVSRKRPLRRFRRNTEPERHTARLVTGR